MNLVPPPGTWGKQTLAHGEDRVIFFKGKEGIKKKKLILLCKKNQTRISHILCWINSEPWWVLYDFLKICTVNYKKANSREHYELYCGASIVTVTYYYLLKLLKKISKTFYWNQHYGIKKNSTVISEPANKKIQSKLGLMSLKSTQHFIISTYN